MVRGTWPQERSETRMLPHWLVHSPSDTIVMHGILEEYNSGVTEYRAVNGDIGLTQEQRSQQENLKLQSFQRSCCSTVSLQHCPEKQTHRSSRYRHIMSHWLQTGWPETFRADHALTLECNEHPS
ncbi:hypothetical protein M404DRAFT_405484 [Pisolithus tinctorius Marx 270]|uniref:Uncharacterized protein n=1 Tax=Pisolithus tinctorius Marx 270 TaxID=870435 RepID=A0A0C3NEK9_PISTI|nr:hypothetical protein M404DRAFT_405484 [Pisolithus tinctorius Marx 270]